MRLNNFSRAVKATLMTALAAEVRLFNAALMPKQVGLNLGVLEAYLDC
jgi:hypothetical protein